jgi:DNA end-binding protein Ku
MAARSIASGTICFGLVNIPVKLYVSASGEDIHFNMLTKTGNRVRQQHVEEGTGNIIDKGETTKGYEYSKGQYVTFTADELKQFEDVDKGVLAIREFVPAASIDLLHVEKSYHTAPDKVSGRAYGMLVAALEQRNVYAVAQWTNRGKRHLVVLRPHKGTIVVHQMYYADEVREQAYVADNIKFSDTELNMAGMLVDSLTVGAFDASKYEDEYRMRVLAAVEAKVAGSYSAPASSNENKPNTADLMDALKASLEAMKTKAA